jgi:hypothetical protein
MLGGEAHLATSLAIVGVAVGAISVLGFAVAMRNAPRLVEHDPGG